MTNADNRGRVALHLLQRAATDLELYIDGVALLRPRSLNHVQTTVDKLSQAVDATNVRLDLAIRTTSLAEGTEGAYLVDQRDDLAQLAAALLAVQEITDRMADRGRDRAAATATAVVPTGERA